MLRRFTINDKFKILFWIVMLLIVGMFFATIFRMGNLKDTFDELQSENEEMRSVMHIGVLMHELSMPPNDYIIKNADQEEYHKYQDLIVQADVAIADLEKYSDNSDREAAMYGEIKGAYEQFKADAGVIFALTRDDVNDSKMAQELMMKSDDADRATVGKLAIFYNYVSEEVGELKDDFLTIQKDVFLIFLFFVIVLIVALVFIRKAMLDSILRPIKKLSLVTEEIARGNLGKKITIHSKDEIGKLVRSFEKMMEAIKQSRKEVDLKVEQQTKSIKRQKEKLEENQKRILSILKEVETEKAKAEHLAGDLEKFKLAVDEASDHIVITDADGVVLYVNRAVEKTTGYPAFEMVGKKAGAKEDGGENMEKNFYVNLWAILKKKKESFSGRVKNVRKNGEEYYLDMSITPIIKEDGKEIKFFLVIGRDITKEVEIDKAKTEFVSLASHQLRTPLTAIKWNAEILLDKLGKENPNLENIKKNAKEIYGSNERMISLINALLDVSRIDMGTFVIDPKDTDVKEICDSVFGELKQDINSKHLKVNVNYGKDLPNVSADPNLLRIVIQNLFSNAVKYTQENGKVSVNLTKESNSLFFTVEDSGIGIPKRQQERIFSKLFRAENAIGKIADGTGLGLYVAKAVIEESGGRIWFESEENKGTKFFFTLPLAGMKKKSGDKRLESFE